MSYSSELKKELLSLPIKKNCCRKAYLFGLLYNSEAMGQNRFGVRFSQEETAFSVAKLLGVNTEPHISEGLLVGRKVYTVEFHSKALSAFFARLAHGEKIEEAMPVLCDLCSGAFLRGLIVSCASVNEPRRDYRLELAFSKSIDEQRINALSLFLDNIGFPPKVTKRSAREILYYRSNTVISDILNFAGAIRQSFEFANTYIEMDIRNNENRATNCVTRNILKSVGANKKYIDAIIALKKRGAHPLRACSPSRPAYIKIRTQ